MHCLNSDKVLKLFVYLSINTNAFVIQTNLDVNKNSSVLRQIELYSSAGKKCVAKPVSDGPAWAITNNLMLMETQR